MGEKMVYNFKTYLENEEHKNVTKMLQSLPSGHRKLLDGYKFKFTPKNVLNGDKNHIGYIYKKKIVVAAPWNYGRAFTTLHEIAHLVWEKKMSKEIIKKWSDLLKKTKSEFSKTLPKKSRESLNQNAEEIFSMVYANVYSKHALLTYSHPDWMKFIMEEVPD